MRSTYCPVQVLRSLLHLRPQSKRRPEKTFFFLPVSLIVMLGWGLPECSRASELTTEVLVPQPIRITLKDVPAPTPDNSPNKKPEVDPVPDKAVLKAPEGFTVSLHADGLKQARWLALTPDGDVLVAQSRENKIAILRDLNKDGSVDENTVFADSGNGLNQPMGMAFIDGYFILGNTNGIRRYLWKSGQHKLEGAGEQIAELPGGGYNQHWTRNVVTSPDGKWLYVSVGSASNVDVEEAPRASVLRMKTDGSEKTVFASGMRNPVGLAFAPGTGDLYAAVNERDRLGDDLVPDYFTRVKEGGFYGWPFAYLSPDRLDPRRVLKDGKSERPDLAAKTITPDVLFQAHSAALGVTFSSGTQFPEGYRNGAFVAFRGSWNRNRGTGYKIVFVPFKGGKPAGYYQDFVTGFLTDPSGPRTWGRPVGTLMQPDGSLLFTEEENGKVYRVNYTKK